MTIFDSSGIEAFVTENNPKYANRIIKQLKAYAKSKGYDNHMILIKLRMVLYLLMLLLILKSNSFTSMDIFVMFSSLALSPTDLELFAIFPFTTRIS